MRHLVMWTAVVLVSLGVVAILAAAAGAQTDPPSSGDWTVQDATLIKDRTVDLHGNLTVGMNGKLTLDNVTLRVFSQSDNVVMGITVEQGGSLTLRSTTGRTIVTRGVSSLPYTFLVEKGASFIVNASSIYGAGVHGGVGGLEIHANNALIVGSTMASGHDFCVGIMGCSGVELVECNVTLSDGAGVRVVDASNVSLTSCSIYNNTGNGVEINDSGSSVSLANVRLDGCTIATNSLTGISAARSRGIIIQDVALVGNLIGIAATDVDDLKMYNVTIRDSPFEGMRLKEGCRDVLVESSRVVASGRDGIMADAVDGLDIANSTVESCTYNGVFVGNFSANLTVRTCVIRYNGYNGVKLDNTAGIDLEGVNASLNGYHGVWFTACDKIEVTGVSLANNSYDGMYSDHSWDMDISGSSMDGNEYSGVELGGNTYNVTILDCSFLRNAKAGAWFTLGRDIRMQRCNLSDDVFFGLRVEGASRDVRATDCIIAGNGENALCVEDSLGVVIEGGRLASPGPGPAILASRNGEARVYNATVDGGVQAKGGANCTIISPRGGHRTVSASGAGSFVDEGWWLSVEVVWPTGGPVPGATVWANSTDAQRSSTGQTDSTGWALWMPVVQRTTTGTGWKDHNPYKVVATKGIMANATIVPIVGDTSLRIYLSDIEPPVARMVDVVAELGMLTFLNGSLSTDNIAIVSWMWSFDDGTGTVQLEGAVVNWTFTELGRFQGEMTVADNAGLVGTVQFNITVADTTPPTVRAGPDRRVPQGSTVELNGTGTTDNDNTLMLTGTFIWVVRTQSGTTIGFLQGPYKTWTFHDMGLYNVTLSVKDQSGNEGHASFNVTVLDTTPSRLDAGPDRTVDERTTVRLEPQLLEDNDPQFATTASVWWVVDGVRLDGRVVEWYASAPGVFAADVHARDAAGNEATSALNITVRDKTPPHIDLGTNRTVEVGTGITLSGKNTTDNDPAFPRGATFKWFVTGPRLELEPTGSSINFTVPWLGRYIVTLEVRDAGGNVARGSLVIDSVDTVAPVFTTFSPPPDVLQNGTKVTLTVGASDVGTGIDPATLQYRLWPAGATDWGNWTAVPLDEGGLQVTASFEATLTEGRNLVQLRVSDYAGNSPVVSAVHIVDVDSRPVAVILTPEEGAVFGPYDLVVLDASPSHDPDANDTLTYRWYSDLNGLLAITVNRTLPPLSPGHHRITLQVSDGIPGHISVATVNITVESVPPARRQSVPTWIWLVLLMVIVAVALLVWDTWRRRARPAPERTVPAEEVPEGEAEEVLVGGPGPPEEGAGAGDPEEGPGPP